MGQVQCYSTKRSPPTSKRRVLTTLGCCALTGGAVYATMAIQHADALVDQRMSLLGTTENDVAIAIAERENLPVVRAARENPDMYEFEAYAYLRGSAKVQSLTAAVSHDAITRTGQLIDMGLLDIAWQRQDHCSSCFILQQGSN